MYLLPYMSFEPLPAGKALLLNTLTGGRAIVEDSVLDALEQVFDSGVASNLKREMSDRLVGMHVLFPDRAEAEQWLRRRDAEAVLAAPLIEQIELTNRCPYQCKMCPRTSSMTRGLGDMDMALFDSIVAQIAGRQSYVGLHHFGESLLHKGIATAVASARVAGIDTGLSCNPPSLKPSIAKRLLDAGVSELVLSLDSLDAETYRSIRGDAADIARARRHIAELISLRDSGGYDTTITLQLISMRENANERSSFLAYCAEAGVDRGVVINLGRWDFSDKKVTELGDFVAPMNGPYCDRPARSVVVLWDGRVVPCCHDYDGLQVIGDLRRQSLREVWESPLAAAFRSDWNAAQICRQCAFSRAFREERRAEMGFRRFHYAPSTAGARQEYVSPRLRHSDWHFDGFDVLHA